MDSTPFLQATHITKHFYGTKALDDVNLSFYEGEIVGVIGENGAGKSTLMKILAGTYELETGEISIAGRPVRIPNPAAGQKLGISMVYQDTRLIPDLTVFQNIYLHREPLTRLGLTDHVKMRVESRAILKKFGIQVEVNALVRDLTIAQKQLVEIAKSLVTLPRMLILDEPTSSLTPSEVERLFEIVREIRAEGVTIVFISHRISELFQICDRFAVLRDGHLVGEVRADAVGEQELVRMMVGREVEMSNRSEDAQKREIRLLEVKNLSSPAYSEVSFSLYQGEILGFYGIDGNGQREILQTLCGTYNPYQGEILLDGERLTPTSPREANRRGISFLTNDRHAKNVFMSLSIADNLTVPNLSKWAPNGIVSQSRVETGVLDGLRQFNVKYQSAEQLLRELSGGNQQKVALAGRALQNPKILILDEPTIGVDVGSKSEIYQFLHRLVDEGVGVIILSSDMPEIMSTSDRILVVSNGKISGEFDADQATEEQIVTAAVLGIKKPQTSASYNTKADGVPAPPRKSLGKWLAPLAIAALIILFGLIGGALSPAFLSPFNIGLILWQCVPLVLAALGQATIIMAGGIDLSIGPVMSLITCVLSYLLVSQGNGLVAVAAAVLAGLICGLCNAIGVVKLKMAHFVATLATQIIFWGAALILRPTAGGPIDKVFATAVKTKVAGVWPVAAIVMLVVVLLFELLLQRTKFGAFLYATGSNREAAYSSGINVDLVRMLSYIIGSVMAALAGVVLACRVGCGDPNAGTNFSIQTITAVVVGGVAMAGGRGTYTGAMLGAALIIVLQSFLNMIGVSSYWQYVWMGGLILAAVAIHFFTGKTNTGMGKKASDTRGRKAVHSA